MNLHWQLLINQLANRDRALIDDNFAWFRVYRNVIEYAYGSTYWPKGRSCMEHFQYAFQCLRLQLHRPRCNSVAT